LPHEQVQRFVTLDYRRYMALIGLVPLEGRERMIAVGRYFSDDFAAEGSGASAKAKAEVAIRA
jgi:hypothetical protein